jgi:16S rRNA (cytosine967-C5)-methyltransferase
MDVPDHAAVDTSVTLAGQGGLERQKGFVNAVLRRMISEGREWLKKQDEVALNFPDWILRAWIGDYELSTALEIATASLAEASLDITVKKNEEQKLWANTLEASILPTGSLRRTGGGNVADLPGLQEGSWWVQDASSALPVRLMGDVSGKRVIDLCAAPGGKTMQLAASGAQVTAVDRSSARVKILAENLARTGLDSHVETIIADGAEWRPKVEADIVLIDAPCTATGTIRRHPDLLHLKSERDLMQLIDVQARLLNNAAGMVGRGGLIFYCTCSLQKDEGERQVDRFVRDFPEFKRASFKASEVEGLETAITDYGDLRILPYHLTPQGGMDGFFVARLEKI